MKCNESCKAVNDVFLCNYIVKELIEDSNWKQRATINISPKYEKWDDIGLSIHIGELRKKLEDLSNKKVKCERLKDFLESKDRLISIPITFWKKPLMNNIDIAFCNQNCSIPSRIVSGKKVAELFIYEMPLMNYIDNQFQKAGYTKDVLVNLISSLLISSGKLRDYSSIKNKKKYSKLNITLADEKVHEILNDVGINRDSKINELIDGTISDYKHCKGIIENNSFSKLFTSYRGFEKLYPIILYNHHSTILRDQIEENIGDLSNTHVFIYNVYSYCYESIKNNFFLENVLFFPYLALKDYLYTIGLNHSSKKQVDFYFEVCSFFCKLLYQGIQLLISDHASIVHYKNVKGIQALNLLCNDSFVLFVSLRLPTNDLGDLKIKYSHKNQEEDKGIKDRRIRYKLQKNRNGKMVYNINLAMAKSKHLKIQVNEAGYYIKKVNIFPKQFFGRKEHTKNSLHLHTNKESSFFPYINVKKDVFDNMLAVFNTKKFIVKYQLRTFVLYVFYFFYFVLFMTLLLPSQGSSSYLVAILPLLSSLLTMFLIKQWSFVHSLVRGYQRNLGILSGCILFKMLLELSLGIKVDLINLLFYLRSNSSPIQLLSEKICSASILFKRLFQLI